MPSWVSQGVLKGATGATGPAGPGFNWKGAWSAATAYVVNDTVSSAGSSYVCILANTNQTPPNATYWNLVAAQGSTGPTGATGGAGPAGPTGSTGPTGVRGSLYQGVYANTAALPTIDGVAVMVGDMAMTSDTSTFWRAT
jgi:hypothetical protein